MLGTLKRSPRDFLPRAPGRSVEIKRKFIGIGYVCVLLERVVTGKEGNCTQRASEFILLFFFGRNHMKYLFQGILSQ